MSLASRLFAATAVILGAISCGHNQNPSSSDAAIIFNNRSIDQATVYAVFPGADMIRLGTVLSNRTDTLRVSADVTRRAGSVNIVARLLASSSFPQTGPITIGPGDALELTLNNNQSVISVSPVRSATAR